MKYKDGQKLKIMEEHILYELEGYDGLQVGDIVQVFKSKKYGKNGSYMTKWNGKLDDAGWVAHFIEDEDKFKPVADKITDWKKELE